MTAKPAHPDRFLVDRTGTPDPATAEYFVLDVVNDWHAREALAYLGNKLRQRGLDPRAQECFAVLEGTREAHGRVMEARNPKGKKPPKKQNVHP